MVAAATHTVLELTMAPHDRCSSGSVVGGEITPVAAPMAMPIMAMRMLDAVAQVAVIPATPTAHRVVSGMMADTFRVAVLADVPAVSAM